MVSSNNLGPTKGQNNQKVDHMIIQIMQGSNPTYSFGNYGTLRWPKDRKVHGHGTLVVGLEVRRGVANLPKGNSSITGKPSGSSQPESVISPFTRVLDLSKLIHVIGNPVTLKVAYELIKSKPGNMTKGSDETTLDGMKEAWLQELGGQILSGTFKFSPARRIWIPKPGKKEKRPLGIAIPKEKIVQKAIQMILERHYEEVFLDSSHGFRPNRGNHTALKYTRDMFKGISWVIEADITKCFDTIDPNTLLRILRKRISCDKTIALVKNAMSAGYIEGKDFVMSHLGTPQGSVLSPLLCNIYMHELDQFIESLQSEFMAGSSRKRRINPFYTKLFEAKQKCRTPMERRRLQKMMRDTPSADYMDPKFRRLRYVRYADDFIVGIAGTHKQVSEILEKIKGFLKDELKLDLNVSKTKITHFNEERVFFLGTEISGDRSRIKKVVKYSFSNGAVRKSKVTTRVAMRAPIKRVLLRLEKKGFFRRKGEDDFRPTRLGRVFNYEHADILQYYNSVIRGLLNFSSFASNMASFSKKKK